MPKTVACPNCGIPVPWGPESKWRPFCSERCRLIDLGDWLAEHHRVSEPTQDVYESREREEDDGYQ
jgi:endogenous inhibitor of DNA gyrase (YacG/DUF329 family)